MRSFSDDLGIESLLEDSKEDRASLDAILSGSISEKPMKAKGALETAKDILLWPVRNYNYLLAWALPAATTAQYLIADKPLYILVVYIPVSIMFSKLFKKDERAQEYYKPSSAVGKALCWVKKNYLGIGFAAGFIAVAAALAPQLPDIQKIEYEIVLAKEMISKGTAPAGSAEILAQAILNMQKLYVSSALAWVSSGVISSAAIKVLSMLPIYNSYSKDVFYNFATNLNKNLSPEEKAKKMLEREEKMMAKGFTDKNILIGAGQNSIVLGDFQKGIAYYAKAIDEDVSMQGLDLIVKSPLGNAMKISSKSFLNKSIEAKTLEEAIAYALNEFYIDNNPDASSRYWEKALLLAPEEKKDEVALLHALFLSGSGNKKEGRNEIIQLVKNITEIPSLSRNLKKIASSRNDVFEVSGSEFFKDTLVIKRNKGINPEEEKARIFSEYLTTAFLSEIFKKKIKTDFKNIVPVPEAVFQDSKDRFYHVMKRSAGLNLREYFLQCSIEEKESALYRVMESSSIIHARAIAFLEKESNNYFIPFQTRDKHYLLSVPRLQYTDALRKRLIKRIGENPMLENFMKEAENYSHSILEIDALCHGDSYITNFLEDGSWIDLEKRVIANPMIDIAALLELPECAGVDKAKILEHYLTSWEKSCPKKSREIPGLKESYIPSRIFFSLYNTGRAYSHDDSKNAVFFMKNAVSAMEEEKLTPLLNSFYSYVNASGIEQFVSAIKQV